MASTSASQSAAMPALLGGIPTVNVDIPICAVFIVIYACFAATNMTIYQRNLRRHKKFFLSALLFGFCMARILTLVLRIVWSAKPQDQGVAIAAQIFVNAGILIVYIENLILAQRILRAKHPSIGWNPILRVLYMVLYALVGGCLVMVITSIVLSTETDEQHVKQQCRDVQLAGVTYFLIFTLLPLAHLFAVFVLPKSDTEENFGEGSMRAKMAIIVGSTCLCITIAGFKTGAAWSPPRLATQPAWYQSKPAFYVFSFVLEYVALGVLTFSRIDRQFHIPDGSNGPGDYSSEGKGKRDEINVPTGTAEKEMS
jgi:hypothetical protein